MISVLKKVGFVVAFVLVTLVLPAFVLLLFVDSATDFAVYVITYGVIIFAILGYIVCCIRNMNKKLEETMDEIKMQNAAIAYKLANSSAEPVPSPRQPIVQTSPVSTPSVSATPVQPPVSGTQIPLNPAEPLVMPETKKTVKPADDGFDDFK